MKIKLAATIVITLTTLSINTQKASAIELGPLLEKLGTQLIDRLLPSQQQTPNNIPSYSQPPENNYPNNNYPSNNYPSNNNNSYPMPNNNYPSYPSYSSTPSYQPTQNGSSSPAAPFIYNPVIVIPQSPPIFNNYSNNMPR